jgi:chloramphenicol O-acetyltransferase type A
MKEIDLENWERKSHYEWFSSFADPSVAYDVKMNITKVLSFCKEKKMSSFSVIMYVICNCINENKAMRLRILDDKVYEVEKANVAYTIMVNDTCFVNCRANMKHGFYGYLNDVEENKEKYNNSNYVQDEYNSTSVIDDIYCSCTPWLNFVSVKQPIPDMSPENKAIPRACWGKYYNEGDSVFMTLNITANHALVDGLDISNVFNKIQDTFDNIDVFIAKS